MVLVAAALPVFLLFASFAVDVGHFFDYSRNLQNRADAAALAAGTQYGATCFGLGSPIVAGSLTAAQLGEINNIGETAQQYAGWLAGSDAYYTPTDMTGRTLFNLPNLTAGTAGNLHILLNSTANWPGGGNWTMGTAGTTGSPASLCDAGTEDGVNLGPTTDVKITQSQLPLFFPLIGLKPDISAHARVQLQGVQVPGAVRPIAVPDPGDVPCLQAYVIDQTTGTRLSTVSLTEVGTSPPIWRGTTPGTITPPITNGSADHLAVQAFFPNDCSNPAGGGTVYDAPAQGGGIDFINGFKPFPGTITAPTLGSVWLSAGCSGQDPYFYYFTSGTCSVTLHAMVAFPTGQGTPGVEGFMDGALNNAVDMAQVGSTNEWTGSFTISPRSGRHTFTISWFQTNSSVNNKCQSKGDATKNNNPCFFNGGNPVQQTFAAVDDGSDPPDDSGPVSAVQVGCVATTPSTCPTIGGQPTDGATSGVNTIPTTGAGSNPTLQITVQLQGLQNSGRTDPPIILRASVQSAKRTGLIDCGQGSGASADSNAITNGCPHGLQIYDGTTCISDPSPNPWSCVNIITGNRRNQILNGFTNRIGNSCDNWENYVKNGVPVTPKLPNGNQDPRIFTLIITSPNDLANGVSNGSLVHILGAASFYVTGWDGDNWLPNPNNNSYTPIPGCTTGVNDEDEAFPGSGSSNNQIWGHFFKTVELGGGGNGQVCDPNAFGDCVAALTR
jgi:hypothetical protein